MHPTSPLTRATPADGALCCVAKVSSHRPGTIDFSGAEAGVAGGGGGGLRAHKRAANFGIAMVRGRKENLS